MMNILAPEFVSGGKGQGDADAEHAMLLGMPFALSKEAHIRVVSAPRMDICKLSFNYVLHGRWRVNAAVWPSGDV
eukprot:4775754-Prorocentrum_lima.AAC.1